MLTNLFKEKCLCIEMQDCYKQALELFNLDFRYTSYKGYMKGQTIFTPIQIKQLTNNWTSISGIDRLTSNMLRLEKILKIFTEDKWPNSFLNAPRALRNVEQEASDLWFHMQNIVSKMLRGDFDKKIFFDYLGRYTEPRNCFTDFFCPSLPDILSELGFKENNYVSYIENLSLETAKILFCDIRNHKNLSFEDKGEFDKFILQALGINKERYLRFLEFEGHDQSSIIESERFDNNSIIESERFDNNSIIESEIYK